MRVHFAYLLLVVACGGPQQASPKLDLSGAPAGTANAVEPSIPAATDAAAPSSVSSTLSPEPRGDDTTGSVLIGEITAPKKFNPSPTFAGIVPDLLVCYRRARTTVPGLRGKLNLRVTIGENGTVQNVAAEPGGKANDPALLPCLAEAIQGATFPKPGGTAIVIVPLVFRPQ